ncbi:hypothetical protein SDC9_182261 [bioreactor metagenome]|uniref:Uncharacterized protein n=1 Tax=bioreactor metagenome TaxID=1076179 RepID=A0A645H6V9_9ZZZZ
MAETDHLQSFRAGEMLRSGAEVDGQVLIRVVVVHIDGNIKIHTANGVHQRGKCLQADLHGIVHRNSQLPGERFRHLIHAADVVGGVELVVFSVDVDFGVPGNVHPVYLPGPGVHRHQNIGVAAAVPVVHTGNQNRVKVGFTGRVRGLGRQGQLVGILLLGGDVGHCRRASGGLVLPLRRVNKRFICAGQGHNYK